MSELQSDGLKRAVNGQFSQRKIITCNPEVRGFAICTRNEECETCPHALAHLNPEIPLYIFMKGEDS